MDGEWLGCIQPMCSKPGRSWQGPFLFLLKVSPFYQKVQFLCFNNKTSLFYNKKGPTPGASLGCGPVPACASARSRPRLCGASHVREANWTRAVHQKIQTMPSRYARRNAGVCCMHPFARVVDWTWCNTRLYI